MATANINITKADGTSLSLAGTIPEAVASEITRTLAAALTEAVTGPAQEPAQ